MFSGAVGAEVLPTMPVHALAPISSRTPLPYSDAEEEDEKQEFGRSASFTHLSTLSQNAQPTELRRNFSENILTLHPRSVGRSGDSMQTVDKELFRRTSKKAKKRIQSQIFSITSEVDDTENRERKVNGEADDLSKGLSRSFTGTIRSFARKSWISPSRSDSTSNRDRPNTTKGGTSPDRGSASLTTTTSTASASLTSRSSSRSSDQDEQAPKVKPHQRSASGLRPSSLGPKGKSESNLQKLSRTSSALSLKSEHSGARLSPNVHPVKVPPLPASISTDTLSNISLEVNKKKDPLWNVFRGIESDFVSFHSKTSLQRAKILRTSLLPFLSRYAQNSSASFLRAEDLDRRVVILNKWWTTLLEMLVGHQNQSITGTDRPIFLEATAGIMMRHEWRTPHFPSDPSTEHLRPPSIPRSKSSNSFQSDEADSLMESVHENVRNIFMQNLTSQMAFVIDRLSLRNAPASLVAFSGKTCAYAYFYCPGMGDMLSRLWRISPGMLRRIFSEAGINRGEKLDISFEELVAKFPPPVRSLTISTQVALSRHLQRPGCIPPGTENFNWYGSWVWRWSGRDSDLFFVFTKYYHLLVSELLPEEVTAKRRICIPGMALVQAQMLTILEKTIYRQAGQHGKDNHHFGGLGDTEAPDASAALPMTIANASRSIAENRLVMLLRDILAITDPNYNNLQVLFLNSFDVVIKSATKKISLYNNDACFILCDFMEEILPIMSRYHQNHPDTPVLDWPFWLRVCRSMMQSQSTLTQIRLIAFVYGTWSTLISNEERKKELVLDWLLEPEFFHRHFCHWSPMVRHYFYRLLCWRIARHDGHPTDLDIKIIETVADRLNRSWAHYQYLSAEAEMRGMVPLSSSPCSPAPSRCLIIIRTDGQPLTPPTFSSFDKFFPPGWMNQNTPYHSHSSVLNTIPSVDSPSQNNNKKRWSIFRSIIPFGSNTGNSRPGEVTPPATNEESDYFDSAMVDSNGIESISKPISRPVTPPHQAFSFKFSLEWIEGRSTFANKNRKLVAPLLPINAQRVLDQCRQLENNSGTDGQSSRSAPRVILPAKPKSEEAANARYSGRALAEWSQVLTEFHNFYLRRKQEGVPRDDLVETPMISVETFRMVGG